MSYEGKIPPIAEKEKRGCKINVPLDPPYVQELTSNVSINLSPTN